MHIADSWYIHLCQGELVIHNYLFHHLQLKDTESLKDFGECIITIQACVIKKFLQGFMAPKQKKKKKQGGEESSKAEEVDEEKRLAEEARVRERAVLFLF